MKAYVIVRVTVTDPERYKTYAALVPAIIAQYGGTYLVRGGKSVTLEGPAETGRVVVMEFPSLEKAQEFYHSPEYQQAKKLRAGAAEGTLLAVEGV